MRDDCTRYFQVCFERHPGRLIKVEVLEDGENGAFEPDWIADNPQLDANIWTLEVTLRRIIYLLLKPMKNDTLRNYASGIPIGSSQEESNTSLVPGADLRDDDTIHVGQVLDAHGRSYYSLHQMANLVAILHDEDVGINCNDAIFSEDLFQPVIQHCYILAQLPPEKGPQVFTRCLAQSIDPDDFVHPMRS